MSAAPEAFPEEALRPIARDGRPDPPADGESQPVMPEVVRRGQELVEGPVEALALTKDAPELARGLEPLTRREARARAQAESRFRPFWRRRFRTRRPPFVRMRTRKPCVRFRLQLLGWNVLFIARASTAGRLRRGFGVLPAQPPGQTMKVSGSPASRQTPPKNGRVPTLSQPGGLCYRWGLRAVIASSLTWSLYRLFHTC